jgi:hypothetical protein
MRWFELAATITAGAFTALMRPKFAAWQLEHVGVNEVI